MSYELSGKIKLIQDEQTFDSGFRKREIVVTVDDGKYPQDISLEFVQDRAALLDSFSPGQEVTIAFNLRGREYNGRYFNNLNGWKITPQSEAQAAEPERHFQAPATPGGEDAFDDQIPF